MARVQFSLEKDPAALVGLLREIQYLADSEKVALGFWPEEALREAITRRRLFAMLAQVGSKREVAGYLHYSGVFPHAKIQQVAVLSRYRKSGVASGLLNSLVSELERAGFLTIKAEVASDLTTAMSFYQKNDFEVVRTRPGGQVRNRTITVCERQLETDSLFTAMSSDEGHDIDLGIRRRSAGESPFFAFDLNIFFDLVRDRSNSANARRLFGAALAHEIRLAVAAEFVSELQRTTVDPTVDPILQMAMRLPRLPNQDQTELNSLADRIHELVFVKPRSRGAGSTQALSDAHHLAHAALARASAFVTRDGAILFARSNLLSMIGIDVATLDELVALLPGDISEGQEATIQGHGFECRRLSGADLAHYLKSTNAAEAVIREFDGDSEIDSESRRDAIFENEKIVAVGAIRIPKGMEPVARLLVHVRPENVDRDMFADYLLDRLTRFACRDLAATVELVHLPGQSTVDSLAKSRGFLRGASHRDLVKIALGRPLTASNWTSAIREIRRRTGLILPNEALVANAERDELAVTTRSGKTFSIVPGRLEDILSPAIIIWRGRSGVIVPIKRPYADDLLGTSEQSTFSFIMNRDAAFLSRRAYVSSPRTANLMRPESPIVFYESSGRNGRGAAVAAARIVDAVIVGKKEVPSDGLRRLVVDDVDEFSGSDDVLLTTFDNLLVLPKPVPWKSLKELNAVGKANLVTAVSLSSEQITQIFDYGWSCDRTT